MNDEQPPSAPPPPPPPAWPPAPATGTPVGDARSPGLSTGSKVAIGVAVLFGTSIALAVLLSIAAPAFLAQQDRALEAELTSAVRNAALDVEAGATELGGDYTVIPDALSLAERTISETTVGRATLDRESFLTYVEPTRFALCAEHDELPGGVAYVSDEGGLLPYNELPCP